jgi:hypothetical protein
MKQVRFRPTHYALAIAIFVAAAALLNPSAEQHREKIKQAVAERSQLAALLHLGDLAGAGVLHHRERQGPVHGGFRYRDCS